MGCGKRGRALPPCLPLIPSADRSCAILLRDFRSPPAPWDCSLQPPAQTPFSAPKSRGRHGGGGPRALGGIAASPSLCRTSVLARLRGYWAWNCNFGLFPGKGPFPPPDNSKPLEQQILRRFISEPSIDFLISSQGRNSDYG